MSSYYFRIPFHKSLSKRWLSGQIQRGWDVWYMRMKSKVMMVRKGILGDENGEWGEDFFLSLLGLIKPALLELRKEILCWLFIWCIGVPTFLTTLNPCVSSDFLNVLWQLSVNSPLEWVLHCCSCFVKEVFVMLQNDMNLECHI